MDAERSLVTLLAQTGRVDDVVAKGVGSEHFADEECRLIFDFCLEHARRWEGPPSFQAVRDSPAGRGFLFEPTTDSLDYVLHRFEGEVKRRETLLAIEDIARWLDEPEAELVKADERVMEAAVRLASMVPGAKAGSFRAMPQRIAEHKARAQLGDWKGIDMGIPVFDELTKGIQPHEFVSVVGWQGTGKSTLMTYFNWHAYLQGVTPMIFSLEMEASAILRKFDLLALNWERDVANTINSLSLKGFELNDVEMARWEFEAEQASKRGQDIIVIDDIGRPTIDRVYAEVSRRKPGMVSIDYVSLMEAPRASDSIWQDLTRLTKELKLLARTMKIPVLGLAQTNIGGAEAGARLENIAYSRSLGQDSDIVLGLHQDEEMKQNRRMTVRMLKHRDGGQCNVDLLWDPARARFGEWKDHHLFEGKAEGGGDAVVGGSTGDSVGDSSGGGGGDGEGVAHGG